MATTPSPGSTLDGSPMRTVGRPVASILSSATSATASRPMRRALNSRRSGSLTLIWVPRATTCALVRMSPSSLTRKPVPRLLSSASACCGGVPGTRSSQRSLKRRAGAEGRSTPMWTTAGP